MKTRKAFKLALLCLVVGLVGGLWLSHRHRPAPDAARAAAADYQDAAAPSGELLVDFADDVDEAYIRATGERLGLTLRPESRFSEQDRLYVASVDPAAEAADLAALRADPRVEVAEDNLMLGLPEDALPANLEGIRDTTPQRGPSDFPNDPRYGEQWHMEQIHMPATWSAASGEGVIVAVIDTGVAKVEDLAQTEMVPGWNFVKNNANADDDHGHGTHVAGTIAQSTHNGVGVAGVAFKAKIMPLKVLSARGSGSVAGIAQAVRFAADNGAKVINMSLGGEGSCTTAYSSVVTELAAAGVTVVASAGNSAGHAVSEPANCPGVIGVGGLRHVGTKVGFSDLGPELTISAPGGNCVDVRVGAACQYPILTTRNAGTTTPLANSSVYSDSFTATVGTSFSAPLVAATTGLMLSLKPAMTPAEVRSVLQQTARAFPTTGGDNGDGTVVPQCLPPQFGANGAAIDQLQCYCTTSTCGAGMLDAGAAVRAVAATVVTTPTPTPTPTPVADSGGGGGGAMSWPWMLLLALAVWALRGAGRAGTAG